MFTLTTGAFPDLEKRFVSDFIDARRSDPLMPVLVVVPSGAVRTRLQRQCTRESGASGSVLNAPFMDFYGLARRVLAEAPIHHETVITEPAFYAEAIRDLLEGRGDFPLALRSELHQPGRPILEGLPRALAGTLRDLRDSGARVVDSLKVALEGLLGEDAGAAAPALELYARLYATLQQRGVRSSADVLRWATEQVPESLWLRDQRAIFVYGFYDLTGVQLDLLLALAAHPRTRLYFPYEADNPAYAFAERLLKDPAFSSRAASVHPIDSRAGRDTPMEISSSSGVRDEVWSTAKRILALTDAGVPYSELLVTARSLAGYSDVVTEIFTAHHIPFVMNVEEAAGSYPLLKSVRLLLTLDRDDYPVAAVSDLLRSTYFRPAWSDPYVIERLIREAGIARGWSSWRSRLEAWSRRAAPANFPQGPGVARDLLVQLAPLHGALRAPGIAQRWSQHVTWAMSTIERWLSLPRVATFRERTLWQALLETLAELSVLDRLGSPVTRDRFLRVWEEKIDDWKLSFGQAAHAGVQVLDVMSARGLSFDSVFILGMNEKSFPRMIREDPFLPDSARSSLARALGCRLGRKMDGYQEERLLFEFLKRAARGRLVISYQRSDEDGKALVPSLYLQGMAAGAAQIVPRPPVEKWRGLPTDLLTPKELSVLWNRDHRDASRLYPLFGADVTTYIRLCERQAILEDMKPVLGAMDGRVGASPPVVAQLARGLSPASLNDLAECPFRYFAGKILGLPNDLLAEVEEGDLPRDTAGILIHRILELFYRSVPPEKLASLDPQEMPKLLVKAYESGLLALRQTGIDIYPLVWEAQRQLIWERLLVFVQRDWRELAESGFIPTYFEADVRGVIPQLGGELANFPFHGRVDRIDIADGPAMARCRVIDYKTGRPTPKELAGAKSVLKGRYPQLPIYLGLVPEWVASQTRRAIEPDGAYFYNLADLELGGESPSLSADFWETEGKAYAANLGAWLALAQKGVFYIRPSDERGYCHWCAFATLCRKEHRPTAWRSEHSRERQRVEETIKANGSPKKLDH